MVKKFLWGYDIYENEGNENNRNTFDSSLFDERINKLQRDFNKLTQDFKKYNTMINKVNEFESVQKNLVNKLF